MGLRPRKVHGAFAAAIALLQVFIFALSSMSGPHQLEYLGIEIVSALLLVALAFL